MDVEIKNIKIETKVSKTNVFKRKVKGMTDKDKFYERAKECYELKELERLGLSPEMDVRHAILDYISLVLRDNRKLQFIPTAEEKQLFVRHFCDSLQVLLLFGFKKGSSVLAFESSGGFPVIPIKIFRPDLAFVVSEPSQRKAEFLQTVVNELNLDNVEIITQKPEQIKLKHKVDYVVARAARSLQKLAQLGKPFLDVGGYMYTYKTKQFGAELEVITENKFKDNVMVGEIAQYELGGGMYTGLSLVSLVVTPETF